MSDLEQGKVEPPHDLARFHTHDAKDLKNDELKHAARQSQGRREKKLDPPSPAGVASTSI